MRKVVDLNELVAADVLRPITSPGVCSSRQIHKVHIRILGVSFMNFHNCVLASIMFIGVSSFFVLRNSFASVQRIKSLSTISAALTTGAIKDNKVMVFSKSYCPYCAKTKSTLDGLGIKYGLFELDVSIPFS